MNIRTLSIILLAGLLVFSCKGKQSDPDPEYVSAVSSGVLVRTEPIKVIFTKSQDISQEPGPNAFVLSPSAKGTVSWQDEYTLVFTPSESLKPNQSYMAQIKIGDIPPFSFTFMTNAPYLTVRLEPMQIDEQGDVYIRGMVNVEEDTEVSKIEETIESDELGKVLWNHENGEHRFSFNPVKRMDAPRTVSIIWDGMALGSSDNGFTMVEIPGLNSFKMTSISTDNGVILVSFSSAVKTYSDLRGFVSLSGKTDVRYSLEGNIIRIFGDNTGGIPAGTELLIQDLQDVDGNVLLTPVQYTVPAKWEVPEIRLPGNGTVLPTSQGAQLVVETKNVSGLLIEAFHIYGDNMMQFLQVNNLSGTRELDRVGEPAWTKAVDFPWTGADQNRWISRGINVSDLSQKFPGGMFHIRVSFRKRHVHYECDANHGDFSHLTFPDDTFPSYGPSSSSESSYWDYYSDNEDYDWYGWNRYRNDPCHPAFYTPSFHSGINISRNVIVSNLGLLAKKSYDNSWLIATTNLNTARPSPNTDYRIYNYQGRLLSQGKTGADGMAKIPDFSEGSSASLRLIVYAENSLGKSYLKINDSLSLAVSHFDVSGSSPSGGVKGLIYGERGVWRPGDEVYLTFLLSDPQSTLPANHPVTLEFSDPSGRLVTSRTYTTSVDGFYPIAVSTSANAPTGDWLARVRVGGSVFTRAVKIETVMPNRLKMDLDFGSTDIIKSGPRQVSLEAAWLYGAPAPGLKADVSVSFADRETSFAGYADYSFRDPTRNVSSERQSLWNGTLDANSKAQFTINLNPGNSVPGKVTSRFMTRVYEPSGVFSSEQVSMEYSPYKRYVGLKTPKGDAARNMLLTDTDHKAEIVLLDEDGKPVQEKTSVTCAIYQLSWRWWWEMGATEAAEFSSSLSHNALSRGTVDTVNGKASWNFKVNYPEWGRYLIMVQDGNGHAASQIVYIDWPGWAGRSMESGQGSQSMLTLSPEKSSYNTGEKISISFPSNKDAAALAVVEKGGEIVRREWITCNEGITKYEFAAEASMVPNVYVHITLLQPHLQAQNDLPIRLYGIVPVMVKDTRVVLRPKINAPETWQAESKASFTVSESDGRAMAYTVAVVDEGLLGLTRYNLPNPGNTFYAREASFLKSWDLFQDVIGAYSGKLETLLAIGGGDDESSDANKETQRFKPVVRFFGPYQIKAGEQKTETFDLPPYIGALRIMVLAASASGETRAANAPQRAYGTAESSVKVNSDLMVFASLPRILSPNDELEIPVYVNAFRSGNRTVKVSLAVPGAAVQGLSTRDVSFTKTGEQLVRFKVKAPANPGQLRFTITAESAGLTTARHQTDMEVRSTAIPVTKSLYSLISPGETWKGNMDYPGRNGTNSLIMGFSRLPPLNMESRLEYLIHYPHGCVEQTTSGAFPQVYLDKILDLDSKRLGEIRTNVNGGIERLSGMQTSSGGFSYWSGEQTAHDWSSSYVGHFLLEAKKAGYTVRDKMIKDWVNYQKTTAASWQSNNGKFIEQAYRLYTLALAGEADLGSMNRLREQKNMPFQASWRLAAAYWYAGQRDTARNMVRGLSLPQTEYRELSETFGSTLRDKAMILETLILLSTGQGAASDDLGRTKTLVEDISKALSGENWLSTQETAYALIAMAPYMQQNAKGGALTLNYSAAGRSGNFTFNNAMAEESLGSVTGTSTAYTFTNRSAVPVYVRLTARGLPEEGSEPALSEGLGITVQYRDTNGRVLELQNLNPGEDMEVRVTVRNGYSRAVEEIALIVPVPASWEIINTRLAGGASQSTFRYQDIRDDRVMTYFNLNRNEQKTVSFMVNRTYAGSYYLPAIHAYAMYDESIRALIPGVKP